MAKTTLQTALMIANTSGWDTDCNSGNVGCLMGIKNGLKGIDAGPDWRGPVADRLLVSSADGSRSVTDAVSMTYEMARIGCALEKISPPLSPKNNARFHFEFPGSVQGFRVDRSNPGPGSVDLRNVEGQSELGRRSLKIQFEGLDRPVCPSGDTDFHVAERSGRDPLCIDGQSDTLSGADYSGRNQSGR